MSSRESGRGAPDLHDHLKSPRPLLCDSAVSSRENRAIIRTSPGALDPLTALPILVPTGLLYQEPVKGGHFTRNDNLPPLFLLTLYNGEPP